MATNTKAAAETTKAELNALYLDEKYDMDPQELVTKAAKSMAKRKTYSLYEFDGTQGRGLTLTQCLRMVMRANLPHDEWAIKDEGTGEIVVEKKAQLALIPVEFIRRDRMSGHGAKAGLEGA